MLHLYAMHLFVRANLFIVASSLFVGNAAVIGCVAAIISHLH